MTELPRIIVESAVERQRDVIASRIKNAAFHLDQTVPPAVRNQRALQYADVIIKEINDEIGAAYRRANETVV